MYVIFSVKVKNMVVYRCTLSVVNWYLSLALCRQIEVSTNQPLPSRCLLCEGR